MCEMRNQDSILSMSILSCPVPSQSPRDAPRVQSSDAERLLPTIMVWKLAAAQPLAAAQVPLLLGFHIGMLLTTMILFVVFFFWCP